MKYRVHAGCAQHAEYIDALCHGTCAQLVYMTFHKAVRMFIITAKKDMIRIIVQQFNKSIKITGCTSLADDDLHSVLQFVQSFFPRKTFVIGTDAGCYILFCRLAPQSGGMSI